MDESSEQHDHDQDEREQHDHEKETPTKNHQGSKVCYDEHANGDGKQSRPCVHLVQHVLDDRMHYRQVHWGLIMLDRIVSVHTLANALHTLRRLSVHCCDGGSIVPTRSVVAKA